MMLPRGPGRGRPGEDVTSIEVPPESASRLGTDDYVVELAGTFGTATSGTHSMRQDLSTLGIAGNEDIGSLHIVE